MLFQRLDVSDGHAAICCLAHVIWMMMTAFCFSIFLIEVNDLRKVIGPSDSRYNLENSTLNQRSWTKLGQEFA